MRHIDHKTPSTSSLAKEKKIIKKQKGIKKEKEKKRDDQSSEVERKANC